MSDLTSGLSCLLNAPFAPLALGFLEELRRVAPSLSRGWPATPRAGPGPITARGRRSSSRQSRSTGRRRCRHGGGRSSGPGSPSSRAGTRCQLPPPWPGRASRRPRGKFPDRAAPQPRLLSESAGLGPPPSGGGARSRRTKEGSASTRSQSRVIPVAKPDNTLALPSPP